MAKRLQELSLLNGTPRGQARLLIKDNPTGFLEDYSISVSDFKSDLVFSSEVSNSPVVGQIPRVINTDGVPSLPALSARNLTDLASNLPTGNFTTHGLLKLTDATTSTSGTNGGFAVTPNALRIVNEAKPNISGATITGAWTFDNNVTVRNLTVNNATVFNNDISLKGNIVADGLFIIAASGNNNILIAPGNDGARATTFNSNGDIITTGSVSSAKTPTHTNHLTNKAYVDNFNTDITNNLVHKSGTETISGSKIFTSALNVYTSRVALELKAQEDSESVIIDFGENVPGNDFDVRYDVVLSSQQDYGNIRYSFADGVPAQNRNMFINGNMVYHEGNTGAGSGLDSDSLDGLQGHEYVQIDSVQTITGQKTFNTQTNFDSTVNFRTPQLNFFTDTAGQIPKVIISGEPDNNNNIGYIQFENRNGGAFGNAAATRASLLVNSSLELFWKGSKVLTTSDYGAGKGINADLLDGLHATSFINNTDDQLVGGDKTFTGMLKINNSSSTTRSLEISGTNPTINLSHVTAGSFSYRMGTSGNNFLLQATTDNFATFENVLQINSINENIVSFGKQILNHSDNFTISGTHTHTTASRINLGGNANASLYALTDGTPVLSGTGSVSIHSNTDNGAANEEVSIRSGTSGASLSVRSQGLTVNNPTNTVMTNFNYTGDDGSAVIRLTGSRNVSGSESIGQIQSVNTRDGRLTTLAFRTDGALNYTGTAGFITNKVTTKSIALSNITAADIPAVGSFGFVNNFNQTQVNGNSFNVWNENGGGLLVRTEDGVAGVLDSQNMDEANVRFKTLRVLEGFNVESIGTFLAGNRNYINTRNITDAAVDLSDSDIVNVNGLHFSNTSSGITFYRSGTGNTHDNYSSLKIDDSGIVFKRFATGASTYNCAMLTMTDGVSFPCLTWGDGTLGHIRTPNSGLLPFAPSNDSRNLSTIGTASWRFRQTHIDTINCYANLNLADTNSAIITQQYTGTNEIFMQVRGRSSLSVGGFVNSVYNFQVDNSGSGIRLQAGVTPTGSVGNDNMFSVKSHDGKPKLYVGSQRTGTENPNFYVGIALNGTGGNRVIHEGDGGRLLSSEPII